MMQTEPIEVDEERVHLIPLSICMLLHDAFVLSPSFEHTVCNSVTTSESQLTAPHYMTKPLSLASTILSSWFLCLPFSSFFHFIPFHMCPMFRAFRWTQWYLHSYSTLYIYLSFVCHFTF
ncbi:hypothetical protein BDV29DRAFT_147836 [Aspergillus leporis]|uniref:Uncharacterized protein n=1 Tax=Aspergillus leporis TaxID=41062 RepID=A0A5N5WYA4_9EURO|nr:hypothetical protein BDV29DRAFT_147836 [Aspergillus leporis]